MAHQGTLYNLGEWVDGWHDIKTPKLCFYLSFPFLSLNPSFPVPTFPILVNSCLSYSFSYRSSPSSVYLRLERSVLLTRRAADGEADAGQAVRVADEAPRDVEADEDTEEGDGEAHWEVEERKESVLWVRAADKPAVVEDDAGEQCVGCGARGALVGWHHVSFLHTYKLRLAVNVLLIVVWLNIYLSKDSVKCPSQRNKTVNCQCPNRQATPLRKVWFFFFFFEMRKE